MRAKGIIAKPMPDYWYDIHKCIIRDDDDEETRKKKLFNMKIVAANKPYFMTYVYPSLKSDSNKYIKNNDASAQRRFYDIGINSVDDLIAYEPKTKEMEDFVCNYKKYKPTGDNPCVVNRISWLFEKELDGYLTRSANEGCFDYEIMKSGVGYTEKTFKEVKAIYDRYHMRIESWRNRYKLNKVTKEEFSDGTKISDDIFRSECEIACSNEDELCDIVIDLCYKHSKSKLFAWEMCGDTIVRNLLRNSGGVEIPIRADDDAEFKYCGEGFKMVRVEMEVEE